MNDFNDDFPEVPEPSPEQIAFAHEKAEELGRVAQKIGLYQQNFQLGVALDDEGGHTMVVVAHFLPGDVAWSDRVQDPEANSVNEQFRAIQADLEEDEFETYRRQLEERLSDEGEPS